MIAARSEGRPAVVATFDVDALQALALVLGALHQPEGAVADRLEQGRRTPGCLLCGDLLQQVDRLLHALRWSRDDLDPRYPETRPV